ncbi:uncharacterized protein V6R79_012112 [Siganus canaliculatus]
MSLYGSFLSDEQFQCSICLDVFNNPSSTPCGHSFCMACISRYWDGLKICQCPLCKKIFHRRPDLHINRTLREITEQFRSMKGGGGGGGGGGGPGREKHRGGEGGDPGTPDALFSELKKKLPRPLPKLLASLTGQQIPAPYSPSSASLASSVPDHSPIAAAAMNGSLLLPPPLPPPTFTFSSSRRRFTVTGASDQTLPVCERHRRGTLIYCKTDKLCICPECATADHQGHDTVSVEEQWVETKAQLSVSEKEIQEMIRQRIMKIEEIRMSVTALELAVERETTGSVSLYSSLVASIQRSQAELMEVMEISRRAAEHQADAMIRQLELEIKELRRREGALAELVESDDHVHGVKTFPTISSPPPTKDWTGVALNSDLGTASIYRSLAAQMEKFQETLKNIAETGFPVPAVKPSPVRTHPRIKRVQEYAMDVTLDSSTAHPRLLMSEDMKSVRCGDRHQLLPDNMERFDRVVCVLGRELISSGRHYWEVNYWRHHSLKQPGNSLETAWKQPGNSLGTVWKQSGNRGFGTFSAPFAARFN